jgi:hypothetical protein
MRNGWIDREFVGTRGGVPNMKIWGRRPLGPLGVSFSLFPNSNCVSVRSRSGKMPARVLV